MGGSHTGKTRLENTLENEKKLHRKCPNNYYLPLSLRKNDSLDILSRNNL